MSFLISRLWESAQVKDRRAARGGFDMFFFLCLIVHGAPMPGSD